MATLSHGGKLVVDLAVPKTVSHVHAAAAAAAAAAGLTLRYTPNTRCESDFVGYLSTNEASDAYAKQGKKQYVIQQKSWTSMFDPKILLILLMRSSAIHFLPVLEQYAKDVEKLGDADDGMGENDMFPPMPDLKPASKKTFLSIVRDLVVMTTRRVLERTSEVYLPRRWTWKLMKNVQDSAIRKYQRGVVGLALCTKMIQTSFVGHAITVLSEFTVAESIILGKLLSSKTKNRKALAIARRDMIFAAIRCTFSLCGAGLGAGIGSAIKPGIGTFLGLNGGDIAASIFILSMYKRWTDATHNGQ
eukprot:scaffold287_cov337-Pavlova_lutheri.AAC.202